MYNRALHFKYIETREKYTLCNINFSTDISFFLIYCRGKYIRIAWKNAMKLPSMISFKGNRDDAMFSKENTCYSLNYVHTPATYQDTFHFSYFLLLNLTYRSHKKARLNFIFTDFFYLYRTFSFFFSIR